MISGSAFVLDVCQSREVEALEGTLERGRSHYPDQEVRPLALRPVAWQPRRSPTVPPEEDPSPLGAKETRRTP